MDILLGKNRLLWEVRHLVEVHIVIIKNCTYAWTKNIFGKIDP